MISVMASEYFAQSPVLIYPVLALGLFIVVFSIATLRALLANKPDIERLSRMPLEDDFRTRSNDHG